MTTVFISDKKCSVCGASGRFPFNNSIDGNVGPRDLDGRPTLILRSSVYLWIQRCPSCGYCAQEIAENNGVSVELLQKEEYRAQLVNQDFPDTANSFLCHSIIMRYRGYYANAGWSAVFAAWICDDNDYPESAGICRKTALSLFTICREKAIEFADSREREVVYLADLYRRCGDFTNAISLCDREMRRNNGDEILDELYFEKELAEQSDTFAHGIAEVDDIHN